MIGTYRIYKNGVLVNEQPNLITTNGRALILRYLAGNIPLFAGAIAVGTSSTAAVVGDTKLGFEFARGAVTLGAALPASNQVIYKATLPLNAAGIIHEIGLYPNLRTTELEYAGQLYVGFNPLLETLTGGGINTTSYRIGAESYAVTAAAGASTTASATQAVGNFSSYAGTDSFSLAYFLADANTASITVRLRVDTNNYFSYTITTGTTAGYFVTDWLKSAFTATGTPVWDAITSADFIITARAGGATTVQLDGLRINDTDVYADYALVSRSVLTTPEVKTAGEQMDIEYAIGFTI